MKVRKPNFDYSNVPLYWAKNHEFAQRWNTGSLIPAYIEPFLVKVLFKCKPLLEEKRCANLLEDVNIFIKQEMEHCKSHIKFNRHYSTFGYDEIKPMEEAFAADYDRFLETTSLRFQVAYCEGFEALSAISVTAMFEEFDEFFEGANQEVVDLWRWHLAEEYEHRSVMHEVFHQLYGKNPVTGYLWRIYGFYYCMRHMSGFAKRAARMVLAKDRAGMTQEQLARSVANEKRVGKAMVRPAIRHLLEILSPFYQPARRRPPRGVQAYLGEAYPPAPVGKLPVAA
jgi:predicted metal-dependent hydrolase